MNIVRPMLQYRELEDTLLGVECFLKTSLLRWKRIRSKTSNPKYTAT